MIQFRHHFFNLIVNFLMDYSKFIAIDSNIRFGKPYLIGTRISVADVLGWMASGMTTEEILSDFPELKLEQIRACLAFAADREQKLKYA
jgi:uncharacterized protein (DUF433 family)